MSYIDREALIDRLYGVIGWCDFPDTCKVNIGE